MKSVILVEQGVVDYSPDTQDIPVPADGEVLIKVECAVLNPSDLYHIRGDYNGEYKYPLTPGVEGSGTVVGTGGGMLAWYL
jgi:NADPH:quinone reductase-like Zn-dependent oxidoreductase